MQVTPELIREISSAIEGIEYGAVLIKINDSGKYVEICTEHKKRIAKESTGIPSYRTD